MVETIDLKVDKFTFKVAVDRFYTGEGVWALPAGPIVRIGLSDFLQQRSGDIAFAEVKPEGTVLAAGAEAATIETIKVNLNLDSPAAGTIVRVNPTLETTSRIVAMSFCEPRSWTRVLSS